MLVIVAAIHKKDAGQCPDPEAIMPFLSSGKDKWPTKQAAVGDGRRGVAGCLRQTKPYSDFLFNFARCFLSAKTFDMECKTKNLSQMMGATCEAFAVVDYANNYLSWKMEAMQREGEEMSGLSEGSAGSSQSAKPYTGAPGARGKYKGWSGEGLELYDKVVELLGEQRRHERHGAMFDVNLKKRWRDQSGRKRLRDDGSGAESGAGTNHLKMFLEERGIA